MAEDLTSLTIEAAELAPRLCRGCASYHGTWPALRLAGAATGLDADRPVLTTMVKRLLAGGGRRRVLIAGSADTGLLATIAAAASLCPADVRFTVLDLCKTPLHLVRSYAAREGLAVETNAVDLRAYTPAEPQDIVFAHSVLRFVHRDEHREHLARMGRWLAPDGCILYGTRLRDVDCVGSSREKKRRAITTIEAREDIPLELRSRICDWLSQRLDAGSALRQVWTHEELLSLFRHAGFTDIAGYTIHGGTSPSTGTVRPDRIIVAARPAAGPAQAS